MKKQLPLLVMGLVGVGVGVALSSCNFHPPSKPWKEVIDRKLRIEELHCSPAIPGPMETHCHLVVKENAGGTPEPERYLRVSKPLFRNYRIEIITGDENRSAEETGMSCTGLKVFGEGYELYGGCVITHGSSSKEKSHEHTFHAWVQPISEGEVRKWRVDFEFIHDKLNPRHNGNGHTETN